MSTSSSAPRVVVVGGGVLGVSAAAHLVQEGAQVLLVTEGELASGASGRSLSWLNSFGNLRSPAYHNLRFLGIDRYRTLATRIGPTPYLRFDGGLTWPAAGATEQMRDHHRHMTEIGYDSRWLAPEEVGDWTPGVDSTAISPDGALFSPGEGWVDLPWLVGLLAGRVRDGKGLIIEHGGPAKVLVENGRATGVLTAAGERFDADAVLLATGPSVPEQVAEFGVSIPDATPAALLVKTRPVGSELRAVLNTPNVSLRPTPDGGLAMDSDAAAQEVIGDERSGYEVKDTTVEDLMAHASAILAGHPRLEAEWYGVGPKPIPGDGDPVLGPVEEVPGLSVAFSHSGATLALISGELLAREVATGVPSPLLAAFRPSRFR
jgi:glycine/D-amino acid oxidase-like deaminating enzyme